LWFLAAFFYARYIFLDSLLFLFIFCVFSVWGSFPCYLLQFGTGISDLHVICCILALTSPICMFVSLLVFGFLVFGFTWFLVFVFWPHFCRMCSIVVCIQHFIISHTILHVKSNKLHVSGTENTDVI
jgi:hypothetical protein